MKKRLLFVFAHPDDETFVTGATILHYSKQEDVDIRLLCATRGDAGKTGYPPQCRPEELADVREQELYRAAKHLGLDVVDFLEHKDGKLNQVPKAVLSEEIKQYIFEFRPQVVVTFPPHGISGHPDHIAIQEATLEAVLEAGEPSLQKLYYVTIPESAAARAPRRVHFDPDEAITTIIDGTPYLQQLVHAILEHKTQNLSIASIYPGIYEGDYSYVRVKNYYILAWKHPGLHQSIPEKDLFAGICTQ